MKFNGDNFMQNDEPFMYIEKQYKQKNYFLDQDTYSMALDNLVIACVDIALIYDDRMLIGKRLYHPLKDWYIVGGRLRAGEKPQIAASRHIFETLGLQIKDCDVQRYKYIMNFYGAWAKRAHPPSSNGTHTHSSVYAIRISNQEMNSIKLLGEFMQVEWVNIYDVGQSDYHNLLKLIANKLLTTRL